MHSENPIHWQVWDKSVLDYAQKQNALLLISIGYSSCHWCHVMADESFCDAQVAEIMNRHFINIKVDREEQPDIDQLYITAIQLMTGSGGWPLNVVCLPDGRPIWGGMYFKKEDWIESLERIVAIKEQQPEKLTEYATHLEKGIIQNLIPIPKNEESISLNTIIEQWMNNWDFTNGGFQSRQKFLLANSLNFLIDYQHFHPDGSIASFLNHSLKTAINRGLYDKVHGGFMRYCVDTNWRIPHFEKMLYDNALALQLYSNAYNESPNENYKRAVYQTYNFLNKHFYTENTGYAASQSAVSTDKHGNSIEGAYYAYTKEELQSVITTNFPMFCAYYGVNSNGYWKDDLYILSTDYNDKDFAEEFDISYIDFITIKSKWQDALQSLAKTKPYPEVDHKILCSWNALLVTSFVKMYKVFYDNKFADNAKELCDILLNRLVDNYGKVYRQDINGSKQEAYLDDYAFLIQALLAVHEVTQEIKYLIQAKNIADYCIVNFWDKSSNLFYYTKQRKHFATPIDYRDDVIPSSNSSLAKSLYLLGILFPEEKYANYCLQMRKAVQSEMQKHPSAFTNWLSLELAIQEEYYVVFISGEDAERECQELIFKNYKNAYFTTKDSNSGALRYQSCSLNFCKTPMNSRDKLIFLLKNKITE